MTSPLFAYGTLERAALLEEIAGRPAVPPREAVLEGYACRGVRGRSFPAIVEQPGERTPGTLWEGLDEEALRRIDAYEGELYVRRLVRVRVAGDGEVAAWAYVLAGGNRHLLDAEPWRREHPVR